MKKQQGFTLIEILVVLAVLIITLAGGVVVWEKKVSSTPTPTPTLIPTPTLQVFPTPTIIPTWERSCRSEADCPKQMCIPADKPCAQYYCIQGRCQLVEPPISKQEVIIGSLNKKIKLFPGQAVNIASTNLSLILLKITTPPQNCFDCPITAEIEVKSGTNSEKIAFIASVSATEEVAKKLRHKEVFGFRITREELRPQWIILSVQKL